MIKRALVRWLMRIKKKRFCKLNGYNCDECIEHKWVWDDDGITFRGNKCMYWKHHHGLYD